MAPTPISDVKDTSGHPIQNGSSHTYALYACSIPGFSDNGYFVCNLSNTPRKGTSCRLIADSLEFRCWYFNSTAVDFRGATRLECRQNERGMLRHLGGYPNISDHGRDGGGCEWHFHKAGGAAGYHIEAADTGKFIEQDTAKDQFRMETGGNRGRRITFKIIKICVS